jgi:CheY-like chemotaxis protein
MARAVMPMRIVVIEHEKDARDLTAALFEETELDVVECSSWREALRFLEDHADTVAMIFADIDASESAPQMAELMRALWPRIRLVLTGTRKLTPGLPRDAQFMPKPWRALEVLIAAETAAGLRPG